MAILHDIPVVAELTPKELSDISYLSECQFRVFTLLGMGHKTSSIAALPGRKQSIKTIETHVAHVKEKVGLNSIVAVRCLATRFLTHIKVNNLKAVEADYNALLRPYRTFTKI